MARGAFSSGNYLLASGTPSLGIDFTAAAWFRPITKHTGTILSLGHSSNWSAYLLLQSLSTGFARMRIFNGAGTVNEVTANTYTTGAWNFLAGMFKSGTNAQVYLNGTLGSQRSTTVTWPTLDQTAAGCTAAPGVSGFFNGYVGYAAIWQALLSQAQLDATNARFVQVSQQRSWLQHFWRMLGTGDASDDVGSLTLAENGTVGEYADDTYREVMVDGPAKLGFAGVMG